MCTVKGLYEMPKLDPKIMDSTEHKERGLQREKPTLGSKHNN